MKGAHRLANVFDKTEQIGRLLLVPGKHARGKTFHIYVLPEGVVHPDPAAERVEVFGIVSGQPGWTEEYNWKHEGPWQDDFIKALEVRRKAIEKLAAKQEEKKESKKKSNEERIKSLLSDY